MALALHGMFSQLVSVFSHKTMRSMAKNKEDIN
jgi:hypothetical protein